MILESWSRKKILLSIVPANNYRLYRLCKWYVDLYRGENNDDIETNGELRFMQRNLPQCNTVLDIGAHIGSWAFWALRINPKLRLHCFEPSRATYKQLVSQCFPANVICNNFGMSSAPGEKTLFVFEDGAGINSLYRRQGLKSFGLSTQQREEKVCLDTVDNYCEKNNIQVVDFTKIDIEGHELEAFKGMSKLIELGRVNIIQFEYGGCNIDAGIFLKDIFDFFIQFDYSFFKIYPKELRQVVRYDQSFENFQYQNWALIRNGYPFLP